LSTECASQVNGCKDNFLGDDVVDRKFLNVQLIAAARDGQADLVREAIKGGANVETRQPMRIVAGAAPPPGLMGTKVAKSNGPTPLMLAAKSGSVVCVTALLNARAKIQAKDEDGMKAVHWAALSGELSAVQTLVCARANPLDKDNDKLGILDHMPAEVRRDPMELRRWRALIDACQAAEPPPEMAPERGDDDDASGGEEARRALCQRDEASSPQRVQQASAERQERIASRSPGVGKQQLAVPKPVDVSADVGEMQGPAAAEDAIKGYDHPGDDAAAEAAFLGRMLPKATSDGIGD